MDTQEVPKKILTVYFNIHGAMIPFSSNEIVFFSINGQFHVRPVEVLFKSIQRGSFFRFTAI